MTTEEPGFDESDPLGDLAARVASGESIDWKDETRQHPEHADQISSLRLLSELSAVHRRAEPPSQRWGPLEIVSPLGQGSFGTVVRARDVRLNRLVALKLVDVERFADDGRGFLDEARRLAKIDHPNVLRVHGAEVHDGRVGIWTELVEGRTLEEQLSAQGALSAREATLVGIDLCRSLAAIHGAHLVHRDVKTSNVLRAEGGRIVLVDFGSAAELSPTQRPSHDAPSGTPHYMAPELFDGSDATVASDLYGVGVVLYRLVTVRYPIEGETISDMMDNHRRGTMTPLVDHRSDLPGDFVALVHRLLSRDPADRPQSAGTLETKLRGCVDGAPEPGDTSRRVTPYWLALAALLLMIAVVAWQPWTNGSPLTVDWSLERATPSGRERLLTGGRVQPGDALCISVRIEEPAYLYVLNEDSAGTVVALFPDPRYQLTNPLPPGSSVEAPGRLATGETRLWGLDDRGDHETILAVISRDRLPALEATMATLGRPVGGEGRTRLNAEVMRVVQSTLRGAGFLVAAPTTSSIPNQLGSLAERLGQNEYHGGIRVMSWTLRKN